MKYILPNYICNILIFSNQREVDSKNINEIRQIYIINKIVGRMTILKVLCPVIGKNDSLKFYSGSKLSKCGQTTFDNYNLRYPTRANTDKLNFKIESITKISSNAYWVMDEYHLKSEVYNAHSTFQIILKE